MKKINTNRINVGWFLKTMVLVAISTVVLGSFVLQTNKSYASITGTSANTPYTLIEPLPCVGNSQVCGPDNLVREINLKDFIGYIFQFAIAAAVFLAVLMIMVAGFKYITTESISGKSGAKEDIQNAVLGLVVALSSYLILQTIDPRLVALDLYLDQVKIVDREKLTFYKTNEELFNNVVSKNTENYTNAKNVSDNVSSSVAQKEAALDALIDKKMSGTITQEEEVEMLKLRNEILVSYSTKSLVEQELISAETVKKQLDVLLSYQTVDELKRGVESAREKVAQNVLSAYSNSGNDPYIKQDPEASSFRDGISDYYLYTFDAESSMIIFNKENSNILENAVPTKTEIGLVLALRTIDYELPIFSDINKMSGGNLQFGKETAKLVANYSEKETETSKNEFIKKIDLEIKNQNDSIQKFYDEVSNEKLQQKYASETKKRVEYLEELKNQLK